MNLKFDQQNVLELTPEQELFSRQTGVLPDLMLISSDGVPQNWKASKVTKSGKSYYVIPEIKLFTTKEEDAQLLNAFPVQLHFQLHRINNVFLIHWLFCILDRKPDPFIAEITLNPSTHTAIIAELVESPIIIINTYLNGKHVETRYIPNSLQAAAKEVSHSIMPAPLQSSTVFHEAKRQFEKLFELDHDRFTWTGPFSAEPVRVTITESKQLRPSLANVADVQDKPYDGLPDELRPYHFWISDSGHIIMAVLAEHWDEAEVKDDYELPVPVKYVLEKGYEIKDGYVIVAAPYDSEFGLCIDEDYEEF